MLDAQTLLKRLHEHKVEYVVIGGMAMVTHGSSHVTQDLDVAYARSDRNLHDLAGALAPLSPRLRGAPAGLPFLWDVSTIRAGLNFTLDTDLGPIDLFGEVPGIGDYEAVKKLSAVHAVFGFDVPVLSLDGLIAAKKAAGRTKDQLHLIELNELKKFEDKG